MSFRDDVNHFTLTVRNRERGVFVGLATESQRAIVEGSEITGSPGQPVLTGALRSSYIPEFIDANTWQTTTNLAYALPIERGIGAHGPLTLRSAVGGWHSIALLVSAWQRLVEHVTAQVRSGGAGA